MLPRHLFLGPIVKSASFDNRPKRKSVSDTQFGKIFKEPHDIRWLRAGLFAEQDAFLSEGLTCYRRGTS